MKSTDRDQNRARMPKNAVSDRRTIACRQEKMRVREPGAAPDFHDRGQDLGLTSVLARKKAPWKGFAKAFSEPFAQLLLSRAGLKFTASHDHNQLEMNEPIDTGEATHWIVKRCTGGRPGLLRNADGEPVLLAIRAGKAELRRAAGSTPGVYRLFPSDEG